MLCIRPRASSMRLCVTTSRCFFRPSGCTKNPGRAVVKLSWEPLLARQLQRQAATRPGMTGFPAYRDIQSKGLGSARGYTACLPSARRVGYPALVLLAAGIDIDSGKSHPWRANGSPMCADFHAANMPAGSLTSHLSRTNQSHNLGLSGARDREGVTDRQFRASAISSRSRDFFSFVEASFPVPERGHVSRCLTRGLGAAWWMESIP